jgi:hypothetical protein
VTTEDVGTVADYCRRIESYLCQKNGGHLIRVVGPAFEEVRGWAKVGIPLKLVFRGIDQYCERQAGRSTRRRPVRIEFCAADVLTLFDDWRRAVGVTATDQPAGTGRKPSLAAHVQRVVARLIAMRGIEGGAPLPAGTVERAVQALDRIADASRTARGDARDAMIVELAALDADLLQLVSRSLDETTSKRLRREAEEELAAFGERMPPEARSAAVQGAYLRLVREWTGLPRVAYE